MLVEFGKKIYNVPTQWNELNAQQLVDVMQVFYQADVPDGKKIKLFKILSGISTWRLFFTNAETLQDCMYLVNFLFEENKLTVQLLPRFDGFYGPASSEGKDGFTTNLRAGEFAFAEYYFKQYHEQSRINEETGKAIDEEAAVKNLNSLCAVLYRVPKKKYDFAKNPDGDVRIPFNENMVDYYSAYTGKWPINICRVIAHWYHGVHNKLVADFPAVFSGGGDPAKYGLWSIMSSIAEKGNHGTMRQVKQMLVQELLMELDDSMDKARKYEAHLKSNTNG